MKTFTESGLNFQFSDRWKVLKYDEHRFYRYLSGSGFKGVDFIGILDEKQVVLIEVKNYKDRYATDETDPTADLLNNPEMYAEKYAQKFQDTFQLIDIIRKYFKRKWWFRHLRSMLLRFIPRRLLLRFDWGFWNLMIQLIDENNEKIILILWLELNDGIPEAKAESATRQIRQHLQLELEPSGAEVIIASSKKAVLGVDVTD